MDINHGWPLWPWIRLLSEILKASLNSLFSRYAIVKLGLTILSVNATCLFKSDYLSGRLKMAINSLLLMPFNCGAGENSWVPWTARRSNQSILKEINPEYSLQGLMLNMKLQYFDHLMGKVNLLEKSLMLGKIEGKRRRGCQTRCLDGLADAGDMNSSKLQEIVSNREVWCDAVHEVASWTQLGDWTITFHLYLWRIIVLQFYFLGYCLCLWLSG